jgi:hypothetical protein
MNDASITSWRHWWWQRVLVPLAAAVVGAYSYWGVWNRHAEFTCFLVPFGVALWSVFLRIRTRRVLVAGDSSFHLAVRNWHALDLFSTLTLAVFETMVETCSCAFLLLEPKYLAFSVALFGIYIGLSISAQYVLISIRSDVANKSLQATATAPSALTGP